MKSEKSPRLRRRARCSVSAGLERTSETECQGLRLLQVIGAAVGPHVLAEEVHEVVLCEVAGLKVPLVQGLFDQFLEVFRRRLLAHELACHEPASSFSPGPADL